MSLHENTTLGLGDGGKDNTNDFFTANYDSLRQLIERKDRELEDIREFADFERQTLKDQIQEQENKMKSYSSGNTKIGSEWGRIDSSGPSAVTASSKDGIPIMDSASHIQQLRFELSRCKADLEMMELKESKVGLPCVDATKCSRRQSAKDVIMMDFTP